VILTHHFLPRTSTLTARRANVYQDEQSEKWIGEWITARDNRDRIIM
jgi:hypothetical protein